MITAEVTIEGGVRWLTLRVPMEPVPRPSASGKTLVVATTSGFFKTSAEVDGKQVSVSMTATVGR